MFTRQWMAAVVLLTKIYKTMMNERTYHRLPTSLALLKNEIKEFLDKEEGENWQIKGGHS